MILLTRFGVSAFSTTGERITMAAQWDVLQSILFLCLCESVASYYYLFSSNTKLRN